MADPVQRLARQLARIEKAQRDKGSTSQLGSSSIIDGGAIHEFDIDNTLKQVIGQQADGTNTTIQVNGPTPPTPSAPTIELLTEAARISWDGLWVDGAVAPLDLARIDVHLVSAIGIDPLTTPSLATISAAGWGDASIPLIPGEYFAVLVAWTTSGKHAASSESAVFVVLPFEVDLSALEGELSDLATELADVLPITETKIADDAISADKIQANAITAGKILAEAVTAEKILAKTITALQIAVDAITAEEILAGTITANEIAVGAITAEKIFATAIDGMTITGARVQTGASGALVRMDATEGLNSFGPDGSAILSVPVVPDVDGIIQAFLHAALTATSLTVEDFLALRGVNNEFSKGSVTTLATGTTAPSSPLNATVGWPVKPRTFGTNLTLGGRGFAKDGSDFWVVSSFFGGYLDRFTENTGSFDHADQYLLGDWMQPDGLTVLGAYVYVLGRDTREPQPGTYGFGKYYVHKYDKTTGAYISRWLYQPAGTTTGAYSDLAPSMGNNGTDILISQCPNSGGTDNFVYIRRYSTAGVLDATITTAHSPGDHQSSINTGGFDFGAGRYIMTSAANRTIAYSCDASGVRVVGDDFPLPAVAKGMVWDSTAGVFKTLTENGVYTHSKHNWTTATSSVWWGAFSWYDSNATGSTHETLISAKVPWVMKKRAHLTITTPPLPAATGGTDDVTGVRVYFGVGATAPTVGNMKRSSTDLFQTTGGVPGATTATYSDVLSLVTAANTGTPGPFPASTPAEVVATSGGGYLAGDSTGSWPGMEQNWSSQVALTTIASPNSTTNITLAGLSIAITVPADVGVLAVYHVSIDPDVKIQTAGSVNLIELLVDGTPQSAQLVTQGAASTRAPGHKMWRITGLTAGAHTFTARTRNTAGSTAADVNASHTLMTVERKV